MKTGKLNSEPIYTLGVVSRLSGVPVHSVRQYIDKGLILPFKTDTKRHLFSDIDVERLKKIKIYIDNGLNTVGLKCLYAQIPGYYLKSCTDNICDGCTSFSSPIEPCWMACSKNTQCNVENCRSCIVYAVADPVADLSHILTESSADLQD